MNSYTATILSVSLGSLAIFTNLDNTPTHIINSTSLVSRSTAVAPIDHSAFDRLLKKYVNEKGLVNYKGFKSEEKEFNQYLDMLSKNPATDSWPKNEQMAYWINAYNAYTIRLILDHYPVKSIKSARKLRSPS